MKHITFIANVIKKEDRIKLIDFFKNADKQKQDNEFDNRTLNYDLVNDLEIKNIMNKFRWQLTFKVMSHYNEDALYPQFLDLVEWKTGMKMDWHADNMYRDGKPNNTPFRDYSAVTYLNDDYEGGVTQFKNDLTEDILPEAGGVVVFPSDRFHNVSEVTSGTRYTMPMWWSKNERYLNL
tara:strand:+ start:1397 stop:1933 length:537 start_codon:yes stop_codon:yes gene_type:complete